MDHMKALAILTSVMTVSEAAKLANTDEGQDDSSKERVVDSVIRAFENNLRAFGYRVAKIEH